MTHDCGEGGGGQLCMLGGEMWIGIWTEIVVCFLSLHQNSNRPSLSHGCCWSHCCDVCCLACRTFTMYTTSPYTTNTVCTQQTLYVHTNTVCSTDIKALISALIHQSLETKISLRGIWLRGVWPHSPAGDITRL